MKVLVVDDHPLIREGMHRVLRELDASISVVEAEDCTGGLALAAEHADLELILLDIHMPGRSGLDALSDFRTQHPAVPIVVLSGSENRDDVMRALDGGAMGFIPKMQSSRLMVNALRLVLAGGVYLPPEIIGLPRPSADARDVPPVPSSTAVTPAALGLTERQTHVLTFLIQGQPNKLIARALNLTEGTVKIHVTAILKALGVANRTQAAIAVSKLGLKLGPIRTRSETSRGVPTPD